MGMYIFNKNTEKKENQKLSSEADHIPSQLFFSPAKHLDFQLAPQKNG